MSHPTENESFDNSPLTTFPFWLKFCQGLEQENSSSTSRFNKLLKVFNDPYYDHYIYKEDISIKVYYSSTSQNGRDFNQATRIEIQFVFYRVLGQFPHKGTMAIYADGTFDDLSSEDPRNAWFNCASLVKIHNTMMIKNKLEKL